MISQIGKYFSINSILWYRARLLCRCREGLSFMLRHSIIEHRVSSVADRDSAARTGDIIHPSVLVVFDSSWALTCNGITASMLVFLCQGCCYIISSLFCLCSVCAELLGAWFRSRSSLCEYFPFSQLMFLPGKCSTTSVCALTFAAVLCCSSSLLSHSTVVSGNRPRFSLC